MEIVRSVACSSVACLLWVALAVGQDDAGEVLTTPQQKLSYSYGLALFEAVRNLGAELDMAAFTLGLQHASQGSEPLLSDEERQKIFVEYGDKARKHQEEMLAAAAEKQRSDREQYLAEHAAQAGVVTTASGAQYMMLHEGEGPTPGATDRVTFHYRGTLVDGTEFDSSRARGAPSTVETACLVPGLREVLLLMRTGSRCSVCLPPQLGYGEAGAGTKVPPDAILLFDVELLEVAP